MSDVDDLKTKISDSMETSSAAGNIGKIAAGGVLALTLAFVAFGCG